MSKEKAAPVRSCTGIEGNVVRAASGGVVSRLAILAVAVLQLCDAAQAVESSVTFSGMVTGTCVMNVTSVGSMMPDGSLTALSSTHAGGASGVVAVTTTVAGLDIEIVAPTGFDMAPAGIGTPSFDASFTGAGATTIASTAPGTAQTLGVGATVLTVDLTASLASGTFPSGNYAADVIVRCQ